MFIHAAERECYRASRPPILFHGHNPGFSALSSNPFPQDRQNVGNAAVNALRAPQPCQARDLFQRKSLLKAKADEQSLLIPELCYRQPESLFLFLPGKCRFRARARIRWTNPMSFAFFTKTHIR